MQTVAAGFITTMTRLARLEDTHVVILNSAKVSNAFANKRPKLRAITAEYRALIRAEATRRGLPVFFQKRGHHLRSTGNRLLTMTHWLDSTP